MRHGNDEKKEEMTISELCRHFNISRQAVFICIKKKRLKAEKIKGRWVIKKTNWLTYVKSKYNRDFSECDGEKIYDEKCGRISVGRAAYILNVDKQKIYHILRKKLLPFSRCGSAYVLDIKDINLAKESKCFQKLRSL